MDKLKMLQIKKLLKELEFIESDYEYRNEIISEADSEFIKNINEFLNQHPDIKDVYDKKINQIFEKSIQKNEKESEEQTESNVESDEEKTNEEEQTDTNEVKSEDENKEYISPTMKKLYREIVKLTHPDKVKKKHLNELYIVATEYYNKRNKIGLYKVCNELNIEYDIEDDDEQILISNITELKQKIVFFESTFTWKWYNSKTDEEKNQILIEYIKHRLR